MRLFSDLLGPDDLVTLDGLFAYCQSNVRLGSNLRVPGGKIVGPLPPKAAVPWWPTAASSAFGPLSAPFLPFQAMAGLSVRRQFRTLTKERNHSGAAGLIFGPLMETICEPSQESRQKVSVGSLEKQLRPRVPGQEATV